MWPTEPYEMINAADDVAAAAVAVSVRFLPPCPGFTDIGALEDDRHHV